MAQRNPPRLSREELKAQAAAALASFKSGGGVIGQAPAVVATRFACANCGQMGTLGVRAGQKMRCPRCREIVT